MKIVIIPFIFKKIEFTPEELNQVMMHPEFRPVRWWLLKMIGYKIPTRPVPERTAQEQ